MYYVAVPNRAQYRTKHDDVNKHKGAQLFLYVIFSVIKWDVNDDGSSINSSTVIVVIAIFYLYSIISS